MLDIVCAHDSRLNKTLSIKQPQNPWIFFNLFHNLVLLQSRLPSTTFNCPLLSPFFFPSSFFFLFPFSFSSFFFFFLFPFPPSSSFFSSIPLLLLSFLLLLLVLYSSPSSSKRSQIALICLEFGST